MFHVRKSLAVVAATLGLACTSVNAQTLVVETSTSPTQPSTQKTQKNRIGIYDSRAVAVAYAGSAQHRAHLKKLIEQRDQAKVKGNKTELARLKADAKAMQEKLHLQAFSTAPVDDILAQIKEQLPTIQRQAKADGLVSKWDEKRLAKHKDDERVDVTPALIDAFHPNAQQRKSAEEIQKHKPYSSDVIKRMKD